MRAANDMCGTFATKKLNDYPQDAASVIALVTGACAAPPDVSQHQNRPWRGRPQVMMGHSFRVHIPRFFVNRGCLLRSYPRLLSEDRVAVSLMVRLRIITKNYFFL